MTTDGQSSSGGTESTSATVASDIPAPAVDPPADDGAAAGTSAEAVPFGEPTDGGPDVDALALLAQAFSSPELMGCLSGKLGLQTLMQLTSRAPTDEETALMTSCLDDTGEAGADSSVDTLISAEWQERIDAALAPTACESSPPGGYPASYYSGPLIDTHLHIPQLPDDGFGIEADGDEESKGVDFDLYDSIAEEDRPLLGRSVTISSIVCALQNEGSVRAFAFFPVFEDIQVQLVEVADRTMSEYPSLFVPFIQSSGSSASTVEADVLREFLEISPGLFFGHGEVGDSPTEPINPPPDSELYTENFEVDRANGLPVYYHTGEGRQDNMARALESFPDITFIVHGDFVRPHIDALMDDYPNIYFTFNDIFDEITPQFRFGDKEDFISAMRADWDQLLENAVDMYRPMIEDHPDRYLWGTDRADIAWNYDEDIGQLLAEFGRAFIGRFDPEIQEMIAYKNAEERISNNQR